MGLSSSLDPDVSEHILWVMKCYVDVDDNAANDDDDVDGDPDISEHHIGAHLDFLQNLCKFWWIHSIFTNFGDIFVDFFVDSLKFSLFLVIDFPPILPLFFSQYMFTNFGDFFVEFFGES